jgi:glycosyltransferase involved in cell wall biosynthesis
VLSSRWEGFGNVVAEAMACGVPALATDCDFGPREQIDHGVNGWIVRAGDSAALAGAFEALLTQPRIIESLAVAGLSRALDFDIAAVAPVYTRLFLEQAGQSRAIVHTLAASRRAQDELATGRASAA